jgi:hypothetical protein
MDMDKTASDDIFCGEVKLPRRMDAVLVDSLEKGRSVVCKGEKIKPNRRSRTKYIPSLAVACIL